MRDDLSDTNTDAPKTSDALLMEYANSALRHLAQALPHIVMTSVTGVTETTTQVVPSDFIAVKAIEHDGETLSYLTLVAGMRLISTPVSTNYPFGYIIAMNNGLDTIMFTRPLTKDYVLFYAAYYPELTGDTDEVSVPNWAIEAVSLYVQARVMMRIALQDIALRRWTTKIDSGRPQDTPMIPGYDFLMKRYYQLILEHTRGS
jgi:hypothetical protein